MMNLKPKTIKTRKRQAGLTLLELTVVLLVLIGLSGLILPYAQGYLQRTHDSTGNDNLWELNNAINLFQAKYLEYPEDFHALVESGGAIYDDLMNTDLVAAATMGPTQRMSLSMAGINRVWLMKDGASNESATFDAIDVTTEIRTGMATGLNRTLAVVTATSAYPTKGQHLAFAFYNSTAPAIVANFDHDGTLDGTDACYDYVVFGVGPESEMVNTVMSDAPLHFASTGGMGPENKYNRFVAVFRVDKSNTAPCSENTEPAKLVGSAMLMMPPHLFGLAHTQSHTYENITDRSN
ncbi:hypothetical protein MIT9_P2335 [Methylomarinovum caldicuralii]|uniref:Prepilin-type N-terminal cleavage/methylation domain-containing protein n=1 Tax=Methylomarinovum caldicuralii TaxID=438856 RepID=A0AAU9C6E3_9GAMM|nr:hypothetical protein [Methylomarinovum caldicuralii]BCX82749.1 hypothetical protein MIT9_P2335 [Methylomarinovum caldicuralii]